MINENETLNLPKLKLIGTDGNAFSILAKAGKVGRDFYGSEKMEEIMSQATNGDYDHLLQTLMRYFDVE